MAYSKILVTHDGSEFADAALPHARDLARAMGRMERVLRKDSPCSELFCILLQFVKQFGSKVSESGNEGFDGS